jgi:hypothetical protein
MYMKLVIHTYINQYINKYIFASFAFRRYSVPRPIAPGIDMCVELVIEEYPPGEHLGAVVFSSEEEGEELFRCVTMYVCIYVCMYVCMKNYGTLMFLCMYVCTRACMRCYLGNGMVCMCVCMYVCIYVLKERSLKSRSCVHLRVFICMHSLVKISVKMSDQL